MIARLAFCLVVVGSPLAAQEAPRPVRVGARWGIEVHRGGWGDKEIGLQAWFPVRSRLEVVPALDLLHQFPDDPLGAWSGTALRAHLTVRGRPFGRRWLPDLGYGLAARYASAEDAGRSIDVSSFDLTDAAVIAYGVGVWRVRPYAELYLVNLLRSPGEVGAHLFVGVSAAVR